MTSKTNLRWPLNLALSCALGAFAACGGATSPADEESDVIGEGAAYLASTETEEAGEDVADENAVAGAEDSEVDAVAEESSEDMGGDSTIEGPEGCDFGGARGRIKAAFDANGDGRLDATERATLIAEVQDSGRANRIRVLVRHHRHHAFARLRWAFDVDGSGSLDAAERADLVAAMEARCEIKKARIDTNSDGQIDAAERLAAHEARRTAARARWEAFLAEHDTDGDGQLSREERHAGRREDLGEKRDRVKDRFDANDDGHLDDAEKDALKAAIRDRISGATGDRIANGPS